MSILRPRTHGLTVARHRATTANLCSLYPWHTGPGPSNAGPYLGVNWSAGGSGWFYDPFELYGSLLTDSNMLIAGRPGKGKSAAVKAFLHREIGVYGRRRFIAINDPKGEYGPLGEALGIPVIKLHPGGQHRLNPLDPAPGDQTGGLLGRQKLVTGMLSIVAGKRLEPAEEALISRAIEHLAERRLVFDLHDLAHVIGELPAELLAHPELVRLTEAELRAAANPLTFNLNKLLTRTLRGMFDGPTTVNIDWDNGLGVIIDLSAVFEDREALPLVMMAATSWLQSAMTALRGERRGLQVDDEVWALLENEWTVKHLQARLKLCRHWGICNILVCHKLSDLRAQAADGSAAQKVAAGLLADTGTRVFFQQAPDQISDAQDLLGLSDVEASLLPRLARGRALWRVGERAAVVQHVLGPNDHHWADTDQAMSAKPSRFPASGTTGSKSPSSMIDIPAPWRRHCVNGSSDPSQFTSITGWSTQLVASSPLPELSATYARQRQADRIGSFGEQPTDRLGGLRVSSGRIVVDSGGVARGSGIGDPDGLERHCRAHRQVAGEERR